MVAPNAASIQEFLSAPRSAIRGFLFYGSDGMQIAARAEALATSLAKKAGADTEIVRLHDSDAASASERLPTELQTQSLFGGLRIVWLTSFPAKAQAAVLDAVKTPIESAVLIVQAPDLKKSHKAVQVFADAPNLAAIACYGEDRDSLVSRIRDQAASQGCRIDAEVAALIAARCDFSVLIARGETDKIVTYAGPAAQITADDVNACLVDQQTAGLSEIVDFALEGDGRNALLAFDRFISVEQNVTAIFVVLASALQRLHTLRTAVDAGVAVSQAIKELRPPVFFNQQALLSAQLRKWSAASLRAALSELNSVLRETRLKPALAEDLTANFLLRIAKAARGAR